VIGSIVLWPLSLILETGQMSAFAPDTRVNFGLALIYSVLLVSLVAHGSYYWANFEGNADDDFIPWGVYHAVWDQHHFVAKQEASKTRRPKAGHGNFIDTSLSGHGHR